jgi:hypothetical protein
VSLNLNLPRLAEIIEDTSQRLIVQLPVPYDVPRAIRTLILQGAVRDERLLDIYSSAIYRNIALRENLVGLSAEVGLITAWITTPQDQPDLGRLRGLMQGAADQALRPLDRWRVTPLQFCATTPEGLVDVSALPDGSPLLNAASTFGLGSVRT